MSVSDFASVALGAWQSIPFVFICLLAVASLSYYNLGFGLGVKERDPLRRFKGVAGSIAYFGLAVVVGILLGLQTADYWSWFGVLCGAVVLNIFRHRVEIASNYEARVNVWIAAVVFLLGSLAVAGRDLLRYRFSEAVKLAADLAPRKQLENREFQQDLVVWSLDLLAQTKFDLLLAVDGYGKELKFLIPHTSVERIEELKPLKRDLEAGNFPRIRITFEVSHASVSGAEMARVRSIEYLKV